MGSLGGPNWWLPHGPWLFNSPNPPIQWHPYTHCSPWLGSLIVVTNMGPQGVPIGGSLVVPDYTIHLIPQSEEDACDTNFVILRFPHKFCRVKLSSDWVRLRRQVRSILCRKLTVDLLYDIGKQEMWYNLIAKVFMLMTEMNLVDSSDRCGRQSLHKISLIQDNMFEGWWHRKRATRGPLLEPVT